MRLKKIKTKKNKNFLVVMYHHINEKKNFLIQLLLMNLKSKLII